jgi:hypothetical protein
MRRSDILRVNSRIITRTGKICHQRIPPLIQNLGQPLVEPRRLPNLAKLTLLHVRMPEISDPGRLSWLSRREPSMNRRSAGSITCYGRSWLSLSIRVVVVIIVVIIVAWQGRDIGILSGGCVINHVNSCAASWTGKLSL